MHLSRLSDFFITKKSLHSINSAFLKPWVVTQMWATKTMRMGYDPKCELPRLHRWVAKACKLLHVKEKDLYIQDFKSEDPFLREHYDFKTKIKKSESDSR